MVEKGEIAHLEQFHLFPQCFLKAFFLQCVKMSEGTKNNLGWFGRGESKCCQVLA